MHGLDSKRADFLKFWFSEETQKKWWQSTPEFDEYLRKTYGDINAAANAGELDHWADEPRSRLALIIAIDQLNRNLHRSSGQAWAGDEKAASLVVNYLQAHDDKPPTEFNDEENMMFLLPLMHSERLSVHEYCREIYPKLVQNPQAVQSMHDHYDIIKRFGRYPHRNDRLGRESTPEEIEFLKTYTGPR